MPKLPKQVYPSPQAALIAVVIGVLIGRMIESWS